MATDAAGGTLASSAQRTILGMLIVVTWLVALVMVPDQIGGVGQTALAVILTLVAAAAIGGLLLEGYREGRPS